MQSVHQALMRSTTTSTPADPDRAAAAIEAAGALVERLLDEISRRWPGQAQWAKDPAYRQAWARSIAEQTPRAPGWESLTRALAKLSARPFPPSIGALIAEATEPPITEGDARRALLVALAAAGRGEWHAILDAPWQAGSEIGWDRLRQMPARDERTFAAWRTALSDAIEQPDHAVIARRPARPAALLPPSDGELSRRGAAARAALREMHQMLGMPLPAGLRGDGSP